MELSAIRKLIQRSIAAQQGFFQAAKTGKEYYLNHPKILRTGAAAVDEVNAYLKQLGKRPLSSADNRIATNWHKILVDQKIGYLFTYPPQFDTDDSENREELIARITECLGDEFEKVVKQLGIDASNAGRAWLHYWYNPDHTSAYYFIDPMQVVPVYDQSCVKRKLKYLLRYYSYLDDWGNCKTRYELWDDRQVIYLEKLSEEGADIEFELLNGQYNVQPHQYGEIPFIEFCNNATATSDLVMYKGMIDSVDKLISGFANDMDDIQEIIWVIRNYAGEESKTGYNEETGEEVEIEVDLKQRLKAKKYALVDESGGIDVLRNEVPYEARGRFLDILTEQLFISAMAVNPNPEQTGNQSGTYIEFLYSLLELKAGLMETEFRAAFRKLIRAILRYLGEPENLPIEQKWTRNKPVNALEIVQMIAQTPDTVLSEESKTKEHPLTENWQTERERIQKEQQAYLENTIDRYEEPGQQGEDE